MMPILELIQTPNYVIDERYLSIIYFYLEYMEKNTPIVQTVSPAIADKYMGDFKGLLTHMAIPDKYHYVIMLLNGLDSSADYDGSMTSIIIPDTDILDRLERIAINN